MTEQDLDRQVEKDDSSEELFDPQKLTSSITKAIIDSGKQLDELKGMVGDVASEVVEKVQSKDKIKTQEIRSLVLEELEKKDESIADSWRQFDKRYKAG